LPVAVGGKEDRGRVFVVGGSAQIPGAVMLAAEAALRVGAGKLLVATASSVAPHVAVTMPEACVIGLRQSATGELAARSCARVLTEAARYDALAIGPGMIDARAAVELIAECLTFEAPPALVIDAAPLCALGSLRSQLRRAHAAGVRVVLTPHAGEMARLMGTTREKIERDPLPAARAAAAEFGAVVALKGVRTYIVAPEQRAFINTAGNVGLGTSGSGDVLSGVIAGLCARGASAHQAAVWGVSLHARAGDALASRGGRLGYLARELNGELPRLLQSLSSERGARRVARRTR
jgi:hydroxyethylthiazole kinase-like uncharacterized protein yjeF